MSPGSNVKCASRSSATRRAWRALAARVDPFEHDEDAAPHQSSEWAAAIKAAFDFAPWATAARLAGAGRLGRRRLLGRLLGGLLRRLLRGLDRLSRTGGRFGVSSFGEQLTRAIERDRLGRVAESQGGVRLAVGDVQTEAAGAHDDVTFRDGVLAQFLQWPRGRAPSALLRLGQECERGGQVDREDLLLVVQGTGLLAPRDVRAVATVLRDDRLALGVHADHARERQELGVGQRHRFGRHGREERGGLRLLLRVGHLADLDVGAVAPGLQEYRLPLSSSSPSSRSLLGAESSSSALATESESGSVASGIETRSSPCDQVRSVAAGAHADRHAVVGDAEGYRVDRGEVEVVGFVGHVLEPTGQLGRRPGRRSRTSATTARGPGCPGRSRRGRPPSPR